MSQAFDKVPGDLIKGNKNKQKFMPGKNFRSHGGRKCLQEFLHR